MISSFILPLEVQDFDGFCFFTFVLFCSLFVFSWISPREPVPDRNGGTRRAYCVFVVIICIRFRSFVNVLILIVIRRVSSSLHRVACEVELCIRFELAEVSCVHNNNSRVREARQWSDGRPNKLRLHKNARQQ